MNWYKKYGKYLLYPVAWILTIIFFVYVLPSDSIYDLTDNLVIGLFVVTLAVAGYNYGMKKYTKKHNINEKK